MMHQIGLMQCGLCAEVGRQDLGLSVAGLGERIPRGRGAGYLCAEWTLIQECVG
jgi:hypothetical protein